MQAHTLATQVAEDFRNVVSLSVKLRDASVPNDIANPRQLSELTPRELSFWVASLFAGNPYQVGGCGKVAALDCVCLRACCCHADS